MSGCNVPVMRWRQARIEVGASFGNAAKFNRGPASYGRSAGHGGKIGLGPGVEMRAANHDNGTSRTWSGTDSSRRALVGEHHALSAEADDAAPRQISGGRCN